MGQVKEPRPENTVCAELTNNLRARIENWFKRPNRQEKENK